MKLFIPLFILAILSSFTFAYDIKVLCPWDEYTYGWNALTGRDRGGDTAQLGDEEFCYFTDFIESDTQFELSPRLLINTTTVSKYEVKIDGYGLCLQALASWDEDGNFQCERDSPIFYDNNDTQPFARKVDLYNARTVNTWTFIPYDYDDQPMEPVSVQFYFSFDLEDMFDILEVIDEFTVTPTVDNSDIQALNLDQESYDAISEYFDITYTVQYLRLQYKRTTVERNHTRVKVNFVPKGAEFEGLRIYNYMKKEAVSHLNKVTAEGDFDVINVDPIIAWEFENENEIEINFDVNDQLGEGDVEQIKIVPVAENVNPSGGWGTIILVVSTVGIIFVVGYFSRFRRHI